jgi:hypothetical protein
VIGFVHWFALATPLAGNGRRGRVNFWSFLETHGAQRKKETNLKK